MYHRERDVRDVWFGSLVVACWLRGRCDSSVVRQTLDVVEVVVRQFWLVVRRHRAGMCQANEFHDSHSETMVDDFWCSCAVATLHVGPSEKRCQPVRLRGSNFLVRAPLSVQSVYIPARQANAGVVPVGRVEAAKGLRLFLVRWIVTKLLAATLRDLRRAPALQDVRAM